MPDQPSVQASIPPRIIKHPYLDIWVYSERIPMGIAARGTDRLSIDRLKLLHPKIREEALDIWSQAEGALSGRAIPRITYSRRTFAEQQKLYNQGRSTPGPIVSNAKGIPCQSYHGYDLALDFCLLYDSDGNGTFDKAVWDIRTDYDKDKVADWMEVVSIFKKAKWEWGGDFKSFKDYPHMQKVFGLNWRDLWRRVAAGKVDKDGFVLL